MINRRKFISQSLSVAGMGLAVPAIFSKGVVGAAEQTANASVAGKTLIVVQLQGGLDGINTVIPYKEGAYRDNRPTLNIPEQDMIVVNDRVAFHPAMKGFKTLFDAGRLAVVEGVGYPNPNFSHFAAQDIWQSADPKGAASEGWLGHYFEGLTDLEGYPLAGLSVGRTLPSAFESTKVMVPAVESVDTFALQNATGDRSPNLRRETLQRLYDFYRPANTPFAALLDTTLDQAYQSSLDLAAAHRVYKPSVTYPNNPLAAGLQLLAELIDSGGAAGSPLRVGHVSLNGFDTHTQEPQRLQQLLTDTGDALAAFWQDIEAHGRANDVLVMTWSEFGRRVPENAQLGTDHGAAGPMFLIGGGVKPGFYGEPPSLTNLDNGNLRYTTDFRSVYATVLDGWLQAPADEILGERFDRLKLLVA